jgi:GNAT superfamily N-acetyltransferase
MTAAALPTTIRVRTGFKAGDIPAVALMHSANYAEPHGFDGAGLEAYVSRSMADLYDTPGGGELWIAEAEDGTVLGSIGITRESDAEARLRWYIMRDEARGQGVGRRMIEAAIDWTRAQGFTRIWLTTIAGLDASAHLYRSVGFEIFHEHEGNSWGGPACEQHWELRL